MRRTVSRFREKIAGAIFFTALGTAVIAFGLVLFLESKNFVVHATQQTSGKVVGFVLLSSGRSRTHSPVFEFKDSSGTLHTNYNSSGQNPPAYKIGELIKVRYQPEHPETARIDSFTELWLFPTFVLGIGLPVLIGGVYCFVFCLRERRQKQ